MRKIAFSFLLAAGCATAAPPPGHPTPAEAGQLLGVPSEATATLPNWGVVMQAMDSNQYTYVELRTEGGTRWLAVPRTPLKTGDRVRYGDGVKMTNFYSKLLKQTFPEILFVGLIARE